MSLITVREAVPAEYHEVGRLTVEAYEEYEPLIPPEFWGRYRADLRDVAARAERGTVLVAAEAGTIVGAVALRPGGDDLDPWPARWVGVRMLAVSARHRRKGVALALMDECVRRARAWGASALALHTVGFMSAAVGLYKMLGFVRLPAYEVVSASGTVILAYGMELEPRGLTPLPAS